MNHIRNYNNYKAERIIQESYNRKIMLLHNVDLCVTDEELFKRVFEKVLNSYKIESIKEEIRNYVSESEMLNEGFFDKLKDRFPKAAQVSKVLSDKAESALGSILSKVKDAVSFVKKIGQGIKEFFLAVVAKGKVYFTEQIQSGKLKEKIAEIARSKKDGLITDLKEVKEVISFYKTKFMGKLLGGTEKGVTDFMTQEQEPVAEGMMNEGKNVIDTLVHKIEAIPPFSWLHKVAQVGEAGSSQLISAVSGLTNKLGGPSFQLPVIALLIGIVFEQFIKGQAGHWLIDLAGSTTPLGIAIKGLKMVAFFIALIVAIDATLGTQMLAGHDDHGAEHKDETNPSDPVETPAEGEEPKQGETTKENPEENV
jgi:hypothetical protein